MFDWPTFAAQIVIFLITVLFGWVAKVIHQYLVVKKIHKHVHECTTRICTLEKLMSNSGNWSIEPIIKKSDSDNISSANEIMKKI